MRRHGCRQVAGGKRGIGGGDNRRGRELRDRDVIWMSVSAVGPERDDDVGTNPPQLHGDVRNRHAWVRPVEMLIAVVEDRYLADAQYRRGGAQLGLADLRQRDWTGML